MTAICSRSIVTEWRVALLGPETGLPLHGDLWPHFGNHVLSSPGAGLLSDDRYLGLSRRHSAVSGVLLWRYFVWQFRAEAGVVTIKKRFEN